MKKRIMTLLLAAGLVLGTSGAGHATDVKVKGVWDFDFEWANGTFNNDAGNDYTNFRQRLRTQVDFIANESLKGVFFFEVGDQNWGRAAQGASLGTDGTVIEVRYSYIDWVVPDTELKIRMGLQPFNLPGFVAYSSILMHDAAGISLNYSFNDNASSTFFWGRLENENDTTTHRHDAFDLFGLLVPLQFDGVKVTPWGMYSLIGRNSLAGTGTEGHAAGVRNADQKAWVKSGLLPMGTTSFAESDDEDGNVWWAGLTGELTLWNPFRLAFDVNYGSVDIGQAGNMDLKRRGWMASLLAEYKLDKVTPGLIFWYTSGDDSNPYDGSERLPFLRPIWTVTNYGFDGGFGITTIDMFGLNSVGTCGVVGQLKDIQFIEDLSHILKVAYYRGTNDKNMADFIRSYGGTPNNNGLAGTYMTEKDDAVEVDFETNYKIYENLLMNISLGYIHLGLNEGVWGSNILDSMQKNNYKASINFQYAF